MNDVESTNGRILTGRGNGDGWHHETRNGKEDAYGVRDLDHVRRKTGRRPREEKRKHARLAPIYTQSRRVRWLDVVRSYLDYVPASCVFDQASQGKEGCGLLLAGVIEAGLRIL